jgi:hypothetical protein
MKFFNLFSQEKRCGLTAQDVGFKLTAINCAEAGDSSPEFYSKIDMPDGKTALQWLEEWPALRKNVLICSTGSIVER